MKDWKKIHLNVRVGVFGWSYYRSFLLSSYIFPCVTNVH